MCIYSTVSTKATEQASFDSCATWFAHQQCALQESSMLATLRMPDMQQTNKKILREPDI